MSPALFQDSFVMSRVHTPVPTVTPADEALVTRTLTRTLLGDLAWVTMATDPSTAVLVAIVSAVGVTASEATNVEIVRTVTTV